MRQKCYTVYKFSELSPDAQKKAIDNLRDINTDYDWWDFTGPNHLLATKGFEDAKISFSGFWCQGDGASFTARINLETYLKDRPKFRRLIPLAKEGYIAFKVIRGSSNYVHENTCRVEDYCTGIDARHNLLSRLIGELYADLELERYNLSREIYRELEEDYNYRTSDEAIKETIEANDYDFTENGKLD